MRDITLAETIYVFFTTRAFATGVPTVLAGSPVVSAYEDDSATQITAGITLGVSHDSVAGLNLLTIVATTGNGYEAAKDYTLVITTGTVGGVSVVGEVVGEFTIGRSAAATDLANGTDGLGALKAETAAIVADTNELQVDNVPGLIATAQADLDTITGASGVNLLTATQASIDAIETDTSTTLQAELDAIQAAVITNAAGADIAADIIAIKAETATSTWTTQMADSTVADGTRPTREQALLFLTRFLMERSVSTTAVTVRKEDGSTTVATFTLDDAANPTSITRAS